MDKALVFGTKDCRFESCQGQFFESPWGDKWQTSKLMYLPSPAILNAAMLILGLCHPGLVFQLAEQGSRAWSSRGLQYIRYTHVDIFQYGFCDHADNTNDKNMTPAGFEPAQLALVELESTPLDHSGKVSMSLCHHKKSFGYDYPRYHNFTSWTSGRIANKSSVICSNAWSCFLESVMNIVNNLWKHCFQQCWLCWSRTKLDFLKTLPSTMLIQSR